MYGGIMYSATRSLTLIFLFFWVTARGEALLNPDGSITQKNKSVNISEDQMELTLQTNITLPVDTVSVGNIMVFVYDANGLGGRLITRLASTSGISQASPEALMVRQLRLEKANITITSTVTKNPTTNQFQVGSEFKIRLTGSTLYRHFFVIRKVLFVVTSYGKLGEADDHHNDQLFLIFYTKSVGTVTPMSIVTPSTGVTSQDHETTNKPIATKATTPVVPSSVVLKTVSASAQRTVTSPILVTPTFVSPKMSSRVCNTVSPSNTVRSAFDIASASDQNTVWPPTSGNTPSPGGQGISDNLPIRGDGISAVVIVVPILISIIWWLGTIGFSLWKRQQERNLINE